MTKETDFARMVTRFFSIYLRTTNKVSLNTINTYRESFKRLMEFYSNVLGITPDRIGMKDFTRENIDAFLRWLETDRGNANSTVNNRQAALDSFVEFLKYEYPDYMVEYQKIYALKTRDTSDPQISYLKGDGIKLFLEQVDLADKNGLRDYLIFAILLSTGIRVTELINIRVMDISMSEPKSITIHGKGSKVREVPIISWVTPYLRQYMSKYGLDRPERRARYLFVNPSGNGFTRQGINGIVNKYKKLAMTKDSTLIPEDLSPHKLRHTCAMELLNAGVDLIYIRDQLGHESVTTTEVYAKADTARRKKIIEEASKSILPEKEAPEWENNAGLLAFLESLGKDDVKDYVK